MLHILRQIIIILLGLSLSFQANANAQDAAWSYPAIPYTDWAYDPFTIQPPPAPAWPAAAEQGYYFVEPDHPQATDTVVSGELVGDFGRFGYPDLPRRSIPSNGWISDQFAAGTIIWLKGGTHTAANFRGSWSPRFHGTAEAPVWLYGDPDDKPVFNGVKLEIYNSSHLILDNLQWIGGNGANTVLSFTRDRPGPSHHITLKNLRFENLNWIGDGGAIVALTSIAGQADARLYDVVAYRNVFKNNGGGFDWSTVDNDHHAYKINGIINDNPVYRVWIIENQALAGDTADPIDGRVKSLSGNLVQVGDQVASSGNNHHIYVAGNYHEFARQALGYTKRASDVIFSSNYCTDVYNLIGGNGQCYGHQYDLGDYNWWINNVATNSSVGWMHTANNNMTGPLFIIGNLFYGNRNSEANDGWRSCSGVTLFTQKGEHYFVNNVFDNSCHGIWAQTNRHIAADKLHIYNNIFTNISATIDSTSRAISLENSKGLQIFMENNLFGEFDNDVRLNSTTMATISDLNSQSWASNNIQGDPLYVDLADSNYAIANNSPAIDAGSQNYSSGATDVYQQFIDRYTDDVNYPGNPADYWPKDFLNKGRVNGDAIDIGAFEFIDPLTGEVFMDGFEN